MKKLTYEEICESLREKGVQNLHTVALQMLQEGNLKRKGGKLKKKGKETNNQTANGQLFRPNHKTREAFTPSFRFLEAKKKDAGVRIASVILIVEGLGNRRDKHFYTKDCLQKSAKNFEGCQCYADHPSREEEINRPERSIKGIVGYYENVKFIEKYKDGLSAIGGDLCILPGASYDWAWTLIESCVAYSVKYPDKDLVGISINANGVTHEQNEESGVINYVDEITDVFSADIVTRAGAGGKALAVVQESFKKLLEAYSKNPQGGHKTMHKEMEKCVAEMEGLKKKAEAGDVEPASMPKVIQDMIDMLKGLADKMSDEPDGDGADEPEEGEAGEAEGEDDADGKDGKDGDDADASDDDGDEDEDPKDIKEAMKLIKKLKTKAKESKDLAVTAKAEKALLENGMMVNKLLADAHLPAGTYDDLKEVLVGKDEKYCKKLIEARRNFLKSMNKVSVKENGEMHVTESNSGSNAITEALAGLPLKKGGK